MSMLTEEQQAEIVVRTAWSQYLSDGTRASYKRYVKLHNELHPDRPKEVPDDMTDWN